MESHEVSFKSISILIGGISNLISWWVLMHSLKCKSIHNDKRVFESTLITSYLKHGHHLYHNNNKKELNKSIKIRIYIVSTDCPSNSSSVYVSQTLTLLLRTLIEPRFESLSHVNSPWEMLQGSFLVRRRDMKYYRWLTIMHCTETP